MANDSTQLYNFYKRYRWTADDFTGWQSGMVDHSRGMFEGLFGGGITSGFEVSVVSGLGLSVSAGIASGSDGYPHVINSATSVTIDAATTSVRRDLIVARKNLVDNTDITDPLDPYSTVPLRTAQQSQIVVIKGTEASSPSYPATETGDVIIAGIRIENGQSSLAITDFDFEVRDSLGKNSRFQQNQSKFDERLRVSKETNSSIRIKPSQTQVGKSAKNFSYINKFTPSKFPQDATNKFTYADTFVSFQSGTVTGGDAQSLDFTPTVPSAGSWIMATVSLKSDDTLTISYGTQGTREQCIAALESATTTGAGAVALPSQVFRLAFVLLGSADGTNITELDVFDGRSTFYFGGPDSPKVYPNVFVSGAGLGDVTTLSDAIPLMPVAGGVILIMDSITETSTVVVPANIKIIGRGKGVTITTSASIGLNLGKNVILQDIILTTAGSNTLCQLNGDFAIINNCTFNVPSTSATAICVDVKSNFNHIEASQFTGVLAPSLATGIKFNLGTIENSDANCIFTT